MVRSIPCMHCGARVDVESIGAGAQARCESCGHLSVVAAGLVDGSSASDFPTHPEITPAVANGAVARRESDSGLEVDEIALRTFMKSLQDNQNLGLGILGGVTGAVIGALLWGGITALTKYQIGFMAIGVGFLAGYGVRRLGQGVDTVYGLIGAVLAAAGCALGKLLGVCMIVSHAESAPFVDIVGRLSPSIAVSFLQDTFSGMDIIFYGIAMYEGYRFAFRRLTDEEVARFTRPVPG